MTMYPTTGFTPAMTELEITCNQLAAARFFRQSNRKLGTPEAVTYWTNRAKDAIRKLRELNKPADVVEMQARFDALESSLVDIDDAATFEQVCGEMTDLQKAIEKENGAIDDYADGRMMARNLSDTY